MRGSNPAPGTYGDVTQTGFAVPLWADVYEFEPHASPLLLLCRLMDEDTRLRTLCASSNLARATNGEQVNIGLLHCPAKTVLINLR